jgi:hypothetical protein
MSGQGTKPFPILNHFHQIGLRRLESKKRGAKTCFFIFSILLLMALCQYRPDVALYNVLQGPFHLKEDQFAEVVTNFSRESNSIFSRTFQASRSFLNGLCCLTCLSCCSCLSCLCCLSGFSCLSCCTCTTCATCLSCLSCFSCPTCLTSLTCCHQFFRQVSLVLGVLLVLVVLVIVVVLVVFLVLVVLVVVLVLRVLLVLVILVVLVVLLVLLLSLVVINFLKESSSIFLGTFQASLTSLSCLGCLS